MNPRLLAGFGKLREAGDVAAWFWGHEHNLAVYRPYAGVAERRCIGHGAVPVFLDDDPYRVLDGLGESAPELVTGADGQPLRLGADPQVDAHGVVILDLGGKGDPTTARYDVETAKDPSFEETLSTTRSAPPRPAGAGADGASGLAGRMGRPAPRGPESAMRRCGNCLASRVSRGCLQVGVSGPGLAGRSFELPSTWRYERS